ncbi:conserved domain protein [Bacteroides clarus YIT 12056]|uniref:Conserved domain protein n=1 Tax=Bacteroides clarus YIT 12056 TaxID=762984 RepID=A0ABP2KU80_9BACE|nr:conserved domain protein [Bacteroides clarus YIT 12056]
MHCTVPDSLFYKKVTKNLSHTNVTYTFAPRIKNMSTRTSTILPVGVRIYSYSRFNNNLYN